MNKKFFRFGGAILFAVILLTSCEGRKMSNMQPTGDTVEVNVNSSDSVTDSLAPEDPLEASI